MSRTPSLSERGCCSRHSAELGFTTCPTITAEPSRGETARLEEARPGDGRWQGSALLAGGVAVEPWAIQQPDVVFPEEKGRGSDPGTGAMHGDRS